MKLKDSHLCIVTNIHKKISSCHFCGEELDLHQYQVVEANIDSPVCDVCAWQREPGLMYVLKCQSFTFGLLTRLPFVQVPDEIREKFEHRLCNLPNADPVIVCKRLENARCTLDNMGERNSEKTPLVSLLDHEIEDAIKGSDLAIMQNALRAFYEYRMGYQNLTITLRSEGRHRDH